MEVGIYEKRINSIKPIKCNYCNDNCYFNMTDMVSCMDYLTAYAIGEPFYPTRSNHPTPRMQSFRHCETFGTTIHSHFTRTFRHRVLSIITGYPELESKSKKFIRINFDNTESLIGLLIGPSLIFNVHHNIKIVD